VTLFLFDLLLLFSPFILFAGPFTVSVTRKLGEAVGLNVNVVFFPVRGF